MQIPEIENMNWWITGGAFISVTFVIAGIIRCRTLRRLDSGDYDGLVGRKERLLLDWTYPGAFATLFILLGAAGGLVWPMRTLALMVGLTVGCLVEVIIDAQPDKQTSRSNKMQPAAKKTSPDTAGAESCKN